MFNYNVIFTVSDIMSEWGLLITHVILIEKYYHLLNKH